MKIGVALIDDNLIDRTILKKNMELFYPEVPYVNFTSAREALEAIENEEIDVDGIRWTILLDIYMPEMNGFQFVDKFARFETDITEKFCIMMFSSSIDSGDMDKVQMRDSIHKFLSKPINKSLLKQIIDDVTGYFKERA